MRAAAYLTIALLRRVVILRPPSQLCAPQHRASGIYAGLDDGIAYRARGTFDVVVALAKTAAAGVLDAFFVVRVTDLGAGTIDIVGALISCAAAGVVDALSAVADLTKGAIDIGDTFVVTAAATGVGDTFEGVTYFAGGAVDVVEAEVTATGVITAAGVVDALAVVADLAKGAIHIGDAFIVITAVTGVVDAVTGHEVTALTGGTVVIGGADVTATVVTATVVTAATVTTAAFVGCEVALLSGGAVGVADTTEVVVAAIVSDATVGALIAALACTAVAIGQALNALTACGFALEPVAALDALTGSALVLFVLFIVLVFIVATVIFRGILLRWCVIGIAHIAVGEVFLLPFYVLLGDRLPTGDAQEQQDGRQDGKNGTTGSKG